MDAMDRIVAPFILEALDYPYELARQVLDQFPDEWYAAGARPLMLHPEARCGPDCLIVDCDTGVYMPGNDGWMLYDGGEVGARYVMFSAPVQDMLDAKIRAENLAKVRFTFARAAEEASA